jgi:hypothetical protein
MSLKIKSHQQKESAVKGCHQARIERGYLLCLLTGQVERCWRDPPPPISLSLLDSWRL